MEADMDVFEAIEKRHSYRGEYNNTAIPREHLERIVQAGIQAPSGCNAQTTSFVIVTDTELLAKMAAIVDRPVMKTAKANIVCVARHDAVSQEKSFAVEDCSAAVENMMLALTALSYASVWLDGVIRDEGRAGRIAELLGIPEELQVRVVMPIGAPAEEVAQRDRFPFSDRAWFNGWQNDEES